MNDTEAPAVLWTTVMTIPVKTTTITKTTKISKALTAGSWDLGFLGVAIVRPGSLEIS
jgi:hypothetical protein